MDLSSSHANNRNGPKGDMFTSIILFNKKQLHVTLRSSGTINQMSKALKKLISRVQNPIFDNMTACPIQLPLRHTSGQRGFAESLRLAHPWFGPLLFSLKFQDDAPADHNCDFSDVQKAQNGNEDAFRRIIERYQPHVSRLLWRFTRDKNAHEELVQESFVQVYLSLHTYRSQAPFEHWLTRIVTRTGYRFWKQAKRHMHVSLQDADWNQLSKAQTDAIAPQQAAELVHNLLSKLPPRDRLVLTLRYLDQCSVIETAQRTGWTASLVKVQTHRAKQKLKKMLENTNIQFEV